MKFRITVRAMDDEAKKSIAETGEQNKIVLNCSSCTILTTDEDDEPSMFYVLYPAHDRRWYCGSASPL